MWLIKNKHAALAGVAQWIEHQPANREVAGLIHGQGICLGCGPGPEQGMCERQPHIDVSLPLKKRPQKCVSHSFGGWKSEIGISIWSGVGSVLFSGGCHAVSSTLMT